MLVQGVCVTFLLLSFNLKAQQVLLVKSTIGVGGSTHALQGGSIMISHTIGQPSPVQHFKVGDTHLFQGFQHQYVKKEAELLSGPDLTISPNPTGGKVMLSWSGDMIHEMIEVTVFDLNGKVVMRKFTRREGVTSHIEIHDSPDGVYLLRVSGEKTKPVSNALMLRQ